MVTHLTTGVRAALLAGAGRSWIDHEIGVGRSIADMVCLSLMKPAAHLPYAPLSITESVVLATLRARGATRIDLLEKRCGLARGALRAGAIRRLVGWDLVTLEAGGRVSEPSNWTGCFNLLAIEAKLTRWRDALRQAVSYLSYANRSYVALPFDCAAPALEQRAEFERTGVGLLLVHSSEVEVASPGRATPVQHDWRREFVLSRLVQ